MTNVLTLNPVTIWVLWWFDRTLAALWPLWKVSALRTFLRMMRWNALNLALLSTKLSISRAASSWASTMALAMF
jgi:hypothetical protein